MFPIRAHVITPTFRPRRWGMGADELTLEQKIDQKTEQMKKDIKETAIKAAAAQMSLQVGLMFVPVIGWAVGALISLAQYFIGDYYEKQLKQLIDSGMEEINVFAKKANERVTETAVRVYDEEYPSSVALAVSSTPLNGLGENFWGKLEDSVLKPAATIVRKINMIPTNLVVKASRVVVESHIRESIKALDAFGFDSTANDLRKIASKGKEIAEDIEVRAADPKLASDLMSGKETVDVATARLDDIKRTVYADINKETNAAVAKIESPQGRAEIRKQTALTLRNDPSVQALRAKFDADAKQAAKQTVALNNAVSGSSLNKTTALVGTALAAGAAFLFMR